MKRELDEPRFREVLRRVQWKNVEDRGEEVELLNFHFFFFSSSWDRNGMGMRMRMRMV